MINWEEIKKYYPNINGSEKNILREYLQYKILDIIFKQDISSKISFLGGTAIKICYGSSRFSEDLDFDNFDLSSQEFNELSHKIKKELSLLGYEVEIRTVFKGAFRCYIKIPKLLLDSGLSPLKEEKLMIQIDTAPHNFSYKPNNYLLQKFDVFTNINLTDKNILLSQKAETILLRKRAKGRDFYDFVFLKAFSDFNWDYLNYKIKINNQKDLKAKLLERVGELDLEDLARDVEPFLLNPNDVGRILNFKKYIEQVL